MYLRFVNSFQNDFLPKISYSCGKNRAKQKQDWKSKNYRGTIASIRSNLRKITKEKLALEVCCITTEQTENSRKKGYT